ncbi:MAG: histidine kinase [Eubacteriales bacterium]|nr:histidine kinase [Eubacteriales bacterium]
MKGKVISKLHINFNSVYIKLILVMFTILIPLMGLLISSNSYAIHVIRSQVSDSYQRQAAFYTQITDNSLSDIDLYLSNIVINNSDFEILQSTKADNNYTLAYIRLNNKIKQELSLYPLVDTIFYYDAGTDYYSTISASNQSYEVKENVHSCIKEAANSSNPYDLEALIRWQPASFSGDAFLLRVFVSEDHYLGAWISLSKLLRTYELQDTGTGTVSAYISEDGTPIISSGEVPFDQLNYPALSSGYTAKSKNGRYTIVGEDSEHGNLTLVSMIPDSVILNRLPILSTMFRTLSFALLILIPLSTLLLRRIFRKPFSIMTSSMHRIQEGNLEERICTEHMSDEFSTVSRIFNEMMDNIRDLKIKIYEEEINRQNETLVYLQMQVKPHFYLNSLNMIYTLARKNDSALIKDLSMCLIRYFRYMFNESTFVTLSSELEHIRNYLRIQELRFPDSFDYDIEIDDTLKNACVPYLLIQNFVENSMKYAVTLDEKAELRILINPAGESHERFTIRIEDNGPGFPGEVLEKVQKGEVIWADDRKHLGIWNSCRRIHLLYHGTAKIEFDNLRPHGALINITLPVKIPENSVGKEARTGGTYEPVTC